MGCKTLGGPDSAALEYARALRENRLDDAYAVTTGAYRARVSRAEFGRKYSDEVLRHERATAIEAAARSLRARSPELEAIRESDGWRVEEVIPSEGPREALARFLDSAERGDFESAYRLLAASWRSKYTPDRLKADFEAEPLARERLVRARAALKEEVVWKGEAAELPVGEGGAVRLMREGGAFKVAAIE